MLQDRERTIYELIAGQQTVESEAKGFDNESVTAVDLDVNENPTRPPRRTLPEVNETLPYAEVTQNSHVDLSTIFNATEVAVVDVCDEVCVACFIFAVGSPAQNADVFMLRSQL